MKLTKVVIYKFFFEYFPIFYLEVLGAGGATWGFSEMIGLRTEENNEFWRIFSIIITLLFFIIYVVKISDAFYVYCISQGIVSAHSKETSVNAVKT